MAAYSGNLPERVSIGDSHSFSLTSATSEVLKFIKSSLPLAPIARRSLLWVWPAGWVFLKQQKTHAKKQRVRSPPWPRSVHRSVATQIGASNGNLPGPRKHPVINRKVRIPTMSFVKKSSLFVGPRSAPSLWDPSPSVLQRFFVGGMDYGGKAWSPPFRTSPARLEFEAWLKRESQRMPLFWMSAPKPKPQGFFQVVQKNALPETKEWYLTR